MANKDNSAVGKNDASIDVNEPPRADTSPAAPSGSAPSSTQPAPEKPLWNNVITMFGIFMVVMSIVLLLTFMLFSVVSPAANPYVDIVGYLVLPGLLVLGLLVIPFGILVRSWWIRRRDPHQRIEFRYPHFNLNDPSQRWAAKVVVVSTLFLLPLVGVSSYHGYHYTDSTQFCAKVCHQVMEPEAVAHQHSAHARVTCAECHIGAGASWFVKSKLSGTRQVFATLRDTYPRPIPPAIQHLRPARDTCEECHWPQKFFGAQLVEIVRFASDEANTRREIKMLVKTGGGDDATGRMEGIHAHMALQNTIQYVAVGETLQEIPWVKMTDRSGRELIYRSDGRPTSDPKPEGQERQLDCMDCHNRPAHKFRAPGNAVDLFLETGKIDTTLPYIKREAVAAITQPYPDVETGKAKIGSALAAFYQDDYPEIWATRRASVNQAIDAVRHAYERNLFPDMNVDWRTYPDNIGHMTSPGCFRCHEGRHVNQFGEAIRSDCEICHSFLIPEKREQEVLRFRQGEFEHPLKLQGRHAELRCDQCHVLGSAPSTACEGCHTLQADFRKGTVVAFESLDIPAEPMVGYVDCDGCHDLTEPTDIETIDMMCMDCHDDEPERYEGMLARWDEEVRTLLEQAEAVAGEGDRKLLEVLLKAGPLHNMEATRTILERLTTTSAVAAGAPTP